MKKRVSAPQVAVIGNITSPQCVLAATELGRELARRGARLIVYSADPAFVEPHVVDGYTAAGPPVPQSIEVCYPHGYGQTAFNVPPEYQVCFRHHPMPTPRWEVAYYRSLGAVDGFVLLGGRVSTLITGVLALSNRLPLLAVSAFGGSAQEIWNLLTPENGRFTQDEINQMGAPWTPGSAAQLVASLLAQIERRATQESTAQHLRATRGRAEWLTTIIALIVAIAMVVIGLFYTPLPAWLVGPFFAATPMLAGLSGALMRRFLDGRQAHADGVAGMSAPWTALLGLAAGFVSAVLFAFSQVLTNPRLLTSSEATATAGGLGIGGLFVAEFVMGMAAGLSLKRVFTKLMNYQTMPASLPEALSGPLASSAPAKPDAQP